MLWGEAHRLALEVARRSHEQYSGDVRELPDIFIYDKEDCDAYIVDVYTAGWRYVRSLYVPEDLEQFCAGMEVS